MPVRGRNGMRETQLDSHWRASARPLDERKLEVKQLKTLQLLPSIDNAEKPEFPMANTACNLVHCETRTSPNRLPSTI